MLRKSLASCVGAVLALALLSGCGDDGKSGSVSLKFTKVNRSMRVADLFGFGPRTNSDPSSFKMKFIAAYLTEDIDPMTQSNVGTTTMFYLNPQCNNDIGHCDIDLGNTGPNGEAITHVVTDFFDFTSTAAANAAINSQGLPTTVGTYKYVRLEFCKGAGVNPNIEFNEAGMAGAFQYRQGSCTVNSVEMNPPLEVTEGSTLAVNLAYDLSDLVSDVGAGANCSTDPRCFTLPQFTPTAQ